MRYQLDARELRGGMDVNKGREGELDVREEKMEGTSSVM